MTLTQTAQPVRGRHSRGPIEILHSDDVGHVRQTWDARYTHAELRFMAASNEWLVLWNPDSGEYVTGGRWRHRDDIFEITEIAGTGTAVELAEAFAQEASSRGVHLVVVPERTEQRKSQFYSAAGFEPIEEIIVYELHGLRPPRHRPMTPQFEGVPRNDAFQREELLDLDNRTFPWLWWNSAGEFDNYFQADGVSIEMARDDTGKPMAYVGFTRLRGWGHLDRIAVSPDVQGRGLGKKSLEYAIARMVSMGARRVGLSTQSDNHVSRQLYESVGFQRNRAHDYRLYGCWIGERRPVV